MVHATALMIAPGRTSDQETSAEVMTLNASMNSTRFSTSAPIVPRTHHHHVELPALTDPSAAARSVITPRIPSISRARATEKTTFGRFLYGTFHTVFMPASNTRTTPI